MIGRGGVESMLKYHAVGFDMNHTLVRYRLKPFVKHLYEAMCVFLVNQRGYTQDVFPADEAEEHRVFAMFFRAVFDHKTGFLLKMSGTQQVMRAFSGFERVSDEEILRVYGNPPTLQNYDPQDSHSQGITTFDEYHAAVRSPLLARLVELRKKGNAHLAAKDFREIVADVTAAAEHNLRITDREALEGCGYPGYFLPEFLSHPRRYVYPVQKAVLERLSSLRRRGAVTFLISNAYYHIANILMTTAIGPDWRDYFTFMVFEAGKPDFFDLNVRTPKPFRVLDGSEGSLKRVLAADTPAEERVLQGGHASLINRHFFKHISKNFRIAYFSDTIAVKPELARGETPQQNWDIILILEELQELEYGMSEEEYYNTTAMWGSSLFDRNLAENGLEPTATMYFAENYARRAFSRLDAEDCLEAFQI